MQWLKVTVHKLFTKWEEWNIFFWEPIKRNDIVWNFEKFLVDREGRPRFRFHPGNWEGGSVVEPYLQALIAEGNSSATNGSQSFPMNVINVAMKKLDTIFNNHQQKQTPSPRGTPNPRGTTPTGTIPSPRGTTPSGPSHPEPVPEIRNPPLESGPSQRPVPIPEPEPSRG